MDAIWKKRNEAGRTSLHFSAFRLSLSRWVGVSSQRAKSAGCFVITMGGIACSALRLDSRGNCSCRRRKTRRGIDDGVAVWIRGIGGIVAQCIECEDRFPIEFEEQGLWLEIRKATGGPGVFVCPSCANEIGLFQMGAERRTPKRWVGRLREWLGWA